MSTAAAKPQVPESAFQRAFVAYALRQGWRTAHFGDSRRQIRGGRLVGDRQATGFPDWTLVRERVVFAELKGTKTRVTGPQLEWHQALLAAGAEAYIWRPDDWEDIQLILGRASMARGP